MRVLVVDDEKVVADSAVLVFQLHHHEAKAAYSAAEALDLVQEYRPDLLISDVMVKGTNGIELAIQFRNQLASCRVLLISGQADTADLIEQSRTRGYDFEILAKPVLPKELVMKAEGMTKGG